MQNCRVIKCNFFNKTNTNLSPISTLFVTICKGKRRLLDNSKTFPATTKNVF